MITDRLRKFSNAIMAKNIVILRIWGTSYRSLGKFFNNHPELMNLVGRDKILKIHTPSYRTLRMDWYEVNADLIGLIE